MSVVSTSDPFDSKSSATLSLPSWAATCSGVFSTLVLASRWHPDLSKISAVSRCPYWAAKWRGEVPSQSVVIGAPLAKRRLTSAVSPSRAAPSSFLPSSTRDALVSAGLDPEASPISEPTGYMGLTWMGLLPEMTEWLPTRVTMFERLSPLLKEWAGASIWTKIILTISLCSLRVTG